MDYKLLGGIFLEGILSFLSPCVLPLIPLYMSYLVGDNYDVDESGNKIYHTTKVFITTLFFVLGISCTFFLLAISLNAFKDHIEDFKQLITIIGGTLLIIFGLHELGIIHINVLNTDLKLKVDLKLEKMNFLKAFLLGFVFSFGWSACIGPMMANAIMLASTSSNGYYYILAYALGLIIPFLLTGLFTSKVLNFLQNKKNIVNYVIKIAGIILIVFGIYLINSGYQDIKVLKNNANNIINNQDQSTADIQSYLLNYEYKDETGKPIKLSDYKGKYIFLNFTTTWCPYCKDEIPEFTKFSSSDEVECMFVMTPLKEYNANDIDNFLKENELQLKTIIDEEGILFYYCNVNSYPTTFVINPEGEFVVYTTGALNYEGFNNLLAYAKGEN